MAELYKTTQWIKVQETKRGLLQPTAAGKECSGW